MRPTLLGGRACAASGRHADHSQRQTSRADRNRDRRQHAGTVGIVLCILATLVLGLLVNWLSAGLALAAFAFYVGIYSVVLLSLIHI